MKSILVLSILIATSQCAMADLKYEPIQFRLSTSQQSYYEGERITFLITITNVDKENSYPVLLPHTQNTGQKLFYLNLFDKANNTLLLRATEDRDLKMMVHDTGTVQIRYLDPQEQVVIPIYLNDFENYYSYHTINSSHHSFGVPVFAGEYKVNVTYNPKGIALGDSLYEYYSDFGHDIPETEKLEMPENGLTSQMTELKIKRSISTKLKIEGIKYEISYDGHRFWYFKDSIGEGGSNPRLAHVTNIPADSSSLTKGEFFYSHFYDIYAEFIVRFDDGDIKEYRKYQDWCPDYLYTEKYNEFKQRILFQQQLPDGRFYCVSFNQPSNSMHQETYCSADGTLCNVTTYRYVGKNKIVKKDISQTNPCIDIELQGKQRSVYKVIELSE
jgi:hypothetical protein